MMRFDTEMSIGLAGAPNRFAFATDDEDITITYTIGTALQPAQLVYRDLAGHVHPFTGYDLSIQEHVLGILLSVTLDRHEDWTHSLVLLLPEVRLEGENERECDALLILTNRHAGHGAFPNGTQQIYAAFPLEGKAQLVSDVVVYMMNEPAVAL